ncbi:uncharacterized protein LOC134831433 [Culicoides brevitarsis]|uniref:uncharacterized protein LOC134831433 n=1 Tax=Culicoides brevitarsis TaxID=469753 RepID=UPI00307B94AB
MEHLEVDYCSLIRANPDFILNWEQQQNWPTPFGHFLVLENDLETLKNLVQELPAALRQVTSYDETVLYFALKLERYEIARYLLQLERRQVISFLYGQAKGGQSPLTIACDSFDCPGDVIYKLLENGPVFSHFELKLALLNAVKARNVAAIGLLLDYDVLMLNELLDEKSGKYFMHLVFDGKVNQNEIFDHIWDKYREKVDWSVIDGQKATIFHAAMRSTLDEAKKLELLRIFPSYFEPECHDNKQNTILHVAAAWCELPLVQFCCEELKIDPKIKNHDDENALKAAVYRASLGQWELFNEKITYLIDRMFKKDFCFAEITDLFSLTSLHRFYQTNMKLYPLLINACYLDERNSFKSVIEEFLAIFADAGRFYEKCHFICVFLHDKAKVYPEHQSNRREIIFVIGQCVKRIIHSEKPFEPLLNVIRSLQQIPSFTIDSHEFCDYFGILYYELFFVDEKILSDARVRTKLLEFYLKFDQLNLISFDDIVDLNLCKILFQRYSDRQKFILSDVFRMQLHLANNVTLRRKGALVKFPDVQDFHLIEPFLGQKDFNRVFHSEKIMSLKGICRENCRRYFLGEKIKGAERERVIKSLRLPKVLENYLQYKN